MEHRRVVKKFGKINAAWANFQFLFNRFSVEQIDSNTISRVFGFSPV